VSSRSSAALRISLSLVHLAAPIVPRARRADWSRQWDADLRHQWAFLRSQPRRSVAALDLVSRARGAWWHALALRVRSLHMPTFFSDVRYGVRTLASKPGFTLVAILLLALGIGATTTIFSWTEGLVFRPISGVRSLDDIVAIHGTTRTRRDISVSYPNFADMRDARPASLTGMAASRLVAMNLRMPDGPERVWGELVTGDFFNLLQVTPAAGRLISAEDDRTPRSGAVVVLSESFWERRFRRDPGVIGSTAAINNAPFTIVGVAGPNFRGSSSALNAEVWIPMMMQGAVLPGNRLIARGDAWLRVFGRLAPGATIPRVESDLNQIAATLAKAYPEVNENRGVSVYPLWQDPGSPAAILGPIFLILLGVVGVVLVIVCANLASLLLARGAGRQREVAVRMALGASRMRVVRQLFTESALLAILGGAIGFAFALWGSQLLGVFIPPTPQPITGAVELTARLPLIAFGLALVTTILFGLAPAMQTTRASVVPALKETRGAIGGRRRAWLRNTLVVGQVALSVLLIVAAGLFVQTLRQARHADVGFDLEDGLLASIDLQPAGYDTRRGIAFFKELVRELEAVPGVVSVGLARDIPLKLGRGNDTSGEIEGYQPARDEEIVLGYDRVSPGYFRTLGMPLIAGRVFTDEDDANHPPVVIVNETMARRYWKNGDAVGRRINTGEWATVIGVVGDVAYTTVNASPSSFVYFPVYDAFRPDTTLVIRTTGDPAPFTERVRAAVHRLDPNLPLFDVRTMAQHKDTVLFLPRMTASILGAFGAIALVLATVGLYGLLAFVVGQRTPEIGVRMALGARRSEIVRLVVGQGVRLTLIGAALGFTLAFLLMPLVSSQLVGVSARDGLTYAATALVLVAAAGLASYLPARRAAAVDPIGALRYE
jgi:predicted permease